MALNDLGIEVPAATDMFDPDGDMRELGDSLAGRLIIPVANTTARNDLATDLSPSTSEPLFVYRADANVGSRVEWTVDGATWRALSSSRRGPVADIASLPALGDYPGERIYVDDKDCIVWWDEKTAAWQGYWRTYSPAIVGSAAPTLDCAYLIESSGKVTVRYLVTLTAGVAANLSMATPVSMRAGYTSVDQLGTAMLRDNSTSARVTAMPVAGSASTVIFYYSGGSGAPAAVVSSGAAPWTWAVNDSVSGELIFERA